MTNSEESRNENDEHVEADIDNEYQEIVRIKYNHI